DFFQALFIRLQICKFQKVLTTNIIKKLGVLSVVENNLKVFSTAYTVVMRTFGAYKQVLAQFCHRADIVTFRAFGPKALGCFFLLRSLCINSGLDPLKPA